MFPYPIATPQGCNIQTFYGVIGTVGENSARTWNKPVGVSHVYMMLIGAGGDGNSLNGGGSGAVTVWYGAAQNVPNSLLINPGGTTTSVLYRGASLVTLLTANGGSSPTAGATTTAGPFAASGFYKSVAGQNGSTSNVTASTLTFLSGGANTNTNSVTANYGYGISASASAQTGLFQMQPIIVGSGGVYAYDGGIGCGGGGANGRGGPGMVLIASW